MPQTQTEDHILSGRAAVRALLVKPLTDAGLKRVGTVEEHEALVGRMLDRLAYLDAQMLTVLCEVIMGLADGPLHNRWPSWATIMNTATRLRPPPDDERHIMTSWLRSVEGPRAREAGYLVELHGWLRRYGRPPSAYDLAQIRERAAENGRQRQRYAEAVARGCARPHEVEWLNGYLAAQSYCEALVSGGEADRAARVAEEKKGAA